MVKSSDDKDLYSVLGISRTASKAEVKKAYHKLALKNHPDKVAVENREAAEARFKSISRAYEILHDDSNRRLYDQHGMQAFENGGAGMAGDADLDDILAQMFGGMGMNGMPGRGGGFQSKSRKGPNDVKPFEVTLEDLYNGKSRKFMATKRVICTTCKGRGGKEQAKPKQCSSCNGKGFKSALRQEGRYLHQSNVTCDACQGRGGIYNEKDKCKKCKGARAVPKTKLVEVNVPKGYRDKEKIILKGEADQVPDQEPGDVVLVLQEEEHEVFDRSGDDLSAMIEVTLAEALCGLDRVVIKHLDGRGLRLDHQKPKGGILRPMQTIKVPGEGMPIKHSDRKGDLYLTVQIVFPEDDSLQDEKVTTTLRQLLPGSPPEISADSITKVEYDEHANMEEFLDSFDEDDWDDEGSHDDDDQPQCRQQ